MAWCRLSGGCVAAGSRRSSACSARSEVASRARGNSAPRCAAPRAWVPAVIGSGRIWLERLAGIRVVRIQQQFHAQLGLFQGALAVAIQGDAALEGQQRFIERQFALFHTPHELLELVQRLLEIGNLVGCGGAIGLGAQANPGGGQGQCESVAKTSRKSTTCRG